MGGGVIVIRFPFVTFHDTVCCDSTPVSFLSFITFGLKHRTCALLVNTALGRCSDGLVSFIFHAHYADNRSCPRRRRAIDSGRRDTRGCGRRGAIDLGGGFGASVAGGGPIAWLGNAHGAAVAADARRSAGLAVGDS